MTLLAALTVALCLCACLALVLVGGQGNGPPVLTLAAWVLAVALVLGSWLLPMMVIEAPGPLVVWSSLAPASPGGTLALAAADRLPEVNALVACGVALLAVLMLARQVAPATLALGSLVAVACCLSPLRGDAAVASWGMAEQGWSLGLIVLVALATGLPARRRGVVGRLRSGWHWQR